MERNGYITQFSDDNWARGIIFRFSIHGFTSHNNLYVTAFEKTRLLRASNSLNLIISNLTTQYTIDLQFSHNAFIALWNNRSKFETDSILTH